MIHVTCALIENENKVLCAQRSETMALPLKWEFPGGKLEEGETLEACLVREIQEELGLLISISDKLTPSTFSYGANKVICLYPFICQIKSGEINLKEHKQVVWLPAQELNQLDWAAADLPIVHEYITRLHA